MSISQCFARDYADARAKFLAAARGAGAVLRHYQNPLRGPDGERLFTDVAWYGPTGAERVLMTISGTHGNEGFCGSGIQVGWFERGLHKELPASVALVAVHAVNPHGFAWVRRVTEDNVDLNRNFVDYAAPLPDNPGYCELAEAICPAEWSDATCAASRALFEAYAKKNGAMALQTALSGGQSPETVLHLAAHDRTGKYPVARAKRLQPGRDVRVLADEVADRVRIKQVVHASLRIGEFVEDAALLGGQFSAFDGSLQFGGVLRTDVRRESHGFQQAGR